MTEDGPDWSTYPVTQAYRELDALARHNARAYQQAAVKLARVATIARRNYDLAACREILNVLEEETC